MIYNYVVIEREYGSGGTEVGDILSEKAGIPCYGKEILEDAAHRLGIPVSQIERYEEKATNSFLYSIYVVGRISEGSGDLLSKGDKVFMEEQAAIKQLAFDGPAVFVGRCAAKALEDKRNVLTVFIHASPEIRKERAVKEYGIAQSDVENILEKYDKKRNDFYSANVGRKWNDWNNYHLILDSGKIGIPECADIILRAMGKD